MATTLGFFRFVKNALLVVAAAALVLGLVAYSEGAVTVYVHERGPGSHRLWLPVPALAVSEGIRFVPTRDLRQVLQKTGPWLPAIRVAAAEISVAPDGLLVEMRDRDDHVVIRKRGDYLQLDVDSGQDTVRVAVPLSTVRAVAQRLEESRQTAQVRGVV